MQQPTVNRFLVTKNFGTLFLRRFSKLTCFSTLFLIFAGGMVTSTGSGLSVPDWPLSYGMVFPPMIGGVFYEHGHRMVASLVGFFTLCLAIALARLETRKWVKVLGFCALGAVILQGILGGITVLFFLPTAVSVGHGILAQTFFILTIIIAYSQSTERNTRLQKPDHADRKFSKLSLVLVLVVYCQLIIAAIMRHTHSGLAIPDFPTMAGYWLPPFNDAMLAKINHVRLELDLQYNLQLDPVNMSQVMIHFLHRLMAFVIICIVAVLYGMGRALNSFQKKTLYILNIALTVQVLLGISTVLSMRSPVITSLHVATGAAFLGLSVLLLLRISPLQWNAFKKTILL